MVPSQMATVYAGVTGPILFLLGILGLAGFEIPATLSLWEPGEVVLHFALGLAAMFVYGLAIRGGEVPWTFARIVGPIYLILGVIGYAFPDILARNIIHLDPGCNILH